MPITGPQQCVTSESFVHAISSFASATINANKKFISASSLNTDVICRLSELRYPDYEAVIPDPLPEPNLTIDKHLLLSALKKVNIYQTKVPTVKIEFTPGLMSLSFNDYDFGFGSKTEVICEHSVSFDAIGLNMPLLINLLNIVEHDIVKFAFTSERRSVFIFDAAANKTLLIMPILLK